MKRQRPIPRTQAQRKIMLDAAAQRRREEKKDAELRQLRAKTMRLEGDRNRLENQIARDRMAGIEGTPESSAYIDRIIRSMLEKVAREMAIKLAHDPGTEPYLSNCIMQAGRIIASDPMGVMSVAPHGQLLSYVSEDSFERGLRLKVTMPPLTIENVIPNHAFLLARA